MIRDAKKIAKKLCEKNIIREEDVSVTEFILLLLANGAGRKNMIRKMVRDNRFDFWWDNLEENHFICGDKIYVDRKNFLGSLVLMILCANGFVRREIVKS